jgi:molybdenum cofactor cytidylyltransferase
VTKIAAALLVAGASARFGDGSKLTATLSGKPLLCYPAHALIDAGFDARMAVCRPGDAGLRGLLAAEDFELVPNPRHDAGMGTSIAAAAGHAREKDADGLLILPGDMPFVTAETLERIRDAFAPDEGRSIIVAKAGDRRGPPTLFGRDYFGALCALQGDEGGKSVVEAHPDEVFEVECADEGELDDVDTTGALAEAEKRLM